MTRLLIALVSAVVFAGAALGFQNPLRDRLMNNARAEQTVGWYQRADTGEFFLFDRSGTVALLQERDAVEAEVLVLFANRAPGGATSYVTDMGREVVRLTALGGATYFPLDAPDGVIADYASPAGGLAPTPRSPEEVRQRAEALAEQIADVVNNNVAIEYAPAPRSGLGVQYDALDMIARAFGKMSSDRRQLRSLQRVVVNIGEQPSAQRLDDALFVTIAPEYGFAGRTSSDRIADALRNPVRGT